MTVADTTAPGYLLPDSPPVAYDDDLVDLLQPVVSGVTGVPGDLVRPRWQPDDVPQQPPYGTTWIALGVRDTEHPGFAYEGHVDGPDGGHDVLERSEEIEVLVSAYGPGSAGAVASLRDGLSIGQNRAALRAAGMDLVAVGKPVTVPALQTGKWVRRVDVPVMLRRYITRAYPVRTILEVGLGSGLDNEQYLTPINVPAPPAT